MADARESFALQLTGRRFGRWEVLKKSDRRGKHGEIYWLCQCDCGTTRDVVTGSLIRSASPSCGCLSRERFFKHGMEGTRIYNTWAQMLARCNNPKSISYKNYGARGVKVCEQWRDFRNFYADMGDIPEGKTLDRFPNHNGDYEPGNVRWATHKEQSRNKRTSKLFTHNGHTATLAEFAEMHGIKRKVVEARVRNGMALDHALKNIRYNRWNLP